jgi:hypothetical protein
MINQVVKGTTSFHITSLSLGSRWFSTTGDTTNVESSIRKTFAYILTIGFHPMAILFKPALQVSYW